MDLRSNSAASTSISELPALRFTCLWMVTLLIAAKSPTLKADEWYTVQARPGAEIRRFDSVQLERLPPSPSSRSIPNDRQHGVEESTSSFAPWWQSRVAQPIREPANVFPVTQESLIVRALLHSSQIRAFSDEPLIRETTIVEADAAFDWTAFMETKWNDISDPVGNTLTTGGPSQFNDHRWDYSFGTRRKTLTGGRFEIAQRYGTIDNNSVFTVPNPQGTARLTLSYTQPLLRGAGRVYNTSLTMMAQIESDSAFDKLSRQLQEYLMDVSRAYWALYLERGSLLQKRRSYERAAVILTDLRHRQEIDAVTSQMVRARAEAASRRSELLRSETGVRDTESRIRMLVNDPELGTVDQFELTPQDFPTSEYIPVSMQDSLAVAIQNRPEISESLKQIKAASIRLKMSKNELLPVLDLILDSYVSGLRENRSISRAWWDQFGEGAPSYTAGLQLELPIHNRAARARNQRRRLEYRQLQSNFQAAIETLNMEVEVAVRRVETSFRMMHTKFEAMQAAAKDVDYIEKRWKLLPGADQAASLLLEDLLASQDRLAEEEFNFLTSRVAYNLSMIELKRATGTLLQYEDVVLTRGHSNCLPSIHFSKSQTDVGRELFPVPPAGLESHPESDGQSREPDAGSQ